MQIIDDKFKMEKEYNIGDKFKFNGKNIIVISKFTLLGEEHLTLGSAFDNITTTFNIKVSELGDIEDHQESIITDWQSFNTVLFNDLLSQVKILQEKVDSLIAQSGKNGNRRISNRR